MSKKRCSFWVIYCIERGNLEGSSVSDLAERSFLNDNKTAFDCPLDIEELKQYTKFDKGIAEQNLLGKTSESYVPPYEEGSDTTETVIYRRVQGSQGTMSSQQRVIIDDAGNVKINNVNKNLNISIDNGEHSQYFLKGRYGADIYQFEMPKWFDEMVQEFLKLDIKIIR